MTSKTKKAFQFETPFLFIELKAIVRLLIFLIYLY